MLQVTTRLGSLLLVALTMLLALSLAVPATAAAAEVWPSTKTKPANTAYNWMFDLWKPTTSADCIGGYVVTTGPAKNWLPCSKYQPVSPKVDAPRYYLENYKNPPAPAGQPAASKVGNAPISGKIIQPGETGYAVNGGTRVIIPEAKKSKGAFMTATKDKLKGSGQLLGLATLGMGGVVEPPPNAVEIYAAQGVPQGCIDAPATCTSADFKKMMDVNMCGHTYGKCETLGAGQPHRVPLLAMLSDLWANITGQTNEDDPTIPGTDPVTKSKGCRFTVGFEAGGGLYGYGKIWTKRGVIETPQPTTIPNKDYWWNACNPAALASENARVADTAQLSPTCLAADGSTFLGKSMALADNSWISDTSIKTPLCSSGQLLSVMIYDAQTQPAHNSCMTCYKVVTDVEYLNPALLANNQIEGSSTSTTVNCIGPGGQTYTHTTKVTAVSGTVDPTCPKGSTYDSHTTTADRPGQPSRTLDTDGIDPGAKTKWPNQIAAGGAALAVYLDGQPCTAARAECANWPDIAARTPSRVSCSWGGDMVAVSNCYVLSDAYKSETGVIFDPVSGTWVAIDELGNPQASNPQPWNPVNPAPSPGVAPSTGTGTGTNTGGFPVAGEPSPNDACGGKWAWNPFDWVGKQLQCAFVPKTDVKTRITTISTTLTAAPPFSWITPGALVGPAGGACPDWVVHVGSVSENVVCDKPYTNAILGARGPMLVLVQTAMVWPLIRSLWYASIPFLRATPTGGK